MTPSTPGEPVQHNPDNLTPEQVGVEDGWRLLDEDEVPECQDMEYQGMQAWTGPKGLKTWNPDYYGVLRHLTYRTRLSRPELRAARGLPPISETSECKPLTQEEQKRWDEFVASLPSAPTTPAPAIDYVADAFEITGARSTQMPPPAPAGDEATPRTDAEVFYYSVSAEFGRTLERELASSRREVAEIARERDAAVHWAAKLSKALTTTDEGLGTATEKLQAANRANDSLSAQLKSIAKEIEAINKSREEQAGNLAKVSRENEVLKSQLATATSERDEAISSRQTMVEGRKVCLGILLQATGYMPEGVSNGLRELVDARDAAECRARAAEASCTVMREVLGRARGLLDNCMFIQRDINEALASDAGKPLLDELEKVKKDLKTAEDRLNWLLSWKPVHALLQVKFPIGEFVATIDAAIAQKEEK